MGAQESLGRRPVETIDRLAKPRQGPIDSNPCAIKRGELPPRIDKEAKRPEVLMKADENLRVEKVFALRGGK